MEEWIRNLGHVNSFWLTALVIYPLLGLLGVLTSPCSLAAVFSVAGFAGIRGKTERSEVFLSAAFLFIGILISFFLLGGIFSFMNVAVSNFMKQGGKLILGIVCVAAGLLALNVVPIGKLPIKETLNKLAFTQKTALFGIVLGIGTASCGVFCGSPIVPLAVGLAGIKAGGAKAMVLWTTFGLGYAIPLAAILFGLGAGKLYIKSNRATFIIRIISGTALLVVGFYLFATL